jgi:2-iminobutanoate/2-iminopropanoate deaminase
MPITAVATDRAPKAIGPYSQALLHRHPGGSTLYCAGQIPLDPATMELVPGDARAQAEQVMRNVGAVLGAAGLSFAHVVKSTLYLVDLADFAAVNEVYGARFSGAFPARSTVQVAALPRGARVELEVVAVQDAPPARRRAARRAAQGRPARAAGRGLVARRGKARKRARHGSK